MINLQPGDQIDIRGEDNRIAFGKILISSINISYSNMCLIMEIKGEMCFSSFFATGVNSPYYIISDEKKFRVDIKNFNFDRHTFLTNYFGSDERSSSTYYTDEPCYINFLLFPDHYDIIPKYDKKEVVEPIGDRWSILDI